MAGVPPPRVRRRHGCGPLWWGDFRGAVSDGTMNRTQVCAHTCQRTHAMRAGTGLIGHPGHAGRDEIEQELLDSLEGSPT